MKEKFPMMIGTLTCVYNLKEGTATSYYRVSGYDLLPKRMSISKSDMTNVAKVGRNRTNKSVGQLVGRFTKEEESLYKKCEPYVVRTQIFESGGFPSILGYGTIGITNAQKNVRDNGDLIVLQAEDEEWKVVVMTIVKGIANNPDEVASAMAKIDAMWREDKKTESISRCPQSVADIKDEML